MILLQFLQDAGSECEKKKNNTVHDLAEHMKITVTVTQAASNSSRDCIGKVCSAASSYEIQRLERADERQKGGKHKTSSVDTLKQNVDLGTVQATMKHLKHCAAATGCEQPCDLSPCSKLPKKRREEGQP